MTSLTYEIRPIPLPVTDDDLTKYIELRLLALKTNPEAFGSTYEGELANPRERWRLRIDTPERFTVVAHVVTMEQGIRREEWVGTASILTPKQVLYGCEPEKDQIVPYALVGMWVHPEHRRKGLGRKLVETGREWVRARTEGLSDKDRQILLEVHSNNDGAKALYDGAAFVEATGVVPEDPNRIPMVYVIKG
ncbi:acyl-CoA N-acyltransferase [Mycena rebaudengoi]|jgi:GNAT superfamily N-acetyltransferase|nr:acyl-CoA N-acyltransferase [Mycena rebaudengoi]